MAINRVQISDVIATSGDIKASLAGSYTAIINNALHTKQIIPAAWTRISTGSLVANKVISVAVKNLTSGSILTMSLDAAGTNRIGVVRYNKPFEVEPYGGVQGLFCMFNSGTGSIEVQAIEGV